jgi:hypothetical protein
MTGFEINTSNFAKVMPSLTVDGFTKKPIIMGELRQMVLTKGAIVASAAIT